ncbi:MAG: hypothetical protein ACYC6L_02030 [Anaerolineae bacterium]
MIGRVPGFFVHLVRISVSILIIAVSLSGCGILSQTTNVPAAPSQTSAPNGQAGKPAAQPSEAPSKAPSAAAPSAAAPSGADLAVWSQHDQSPAEGKVTYRVYYANLSPEQVADQTVLQVRPPEGAAVLRVSREYQPLSGGSGLEVSLGALQPDEIGYIDLEVGWPTALAPGAWTELNAQISSAAPDPDMLNNTAQDGETVAGPDLALTMKTADNSGPYVPGGTVVIELDYRDNSATEAKSASIVLDLPKGLTYRIASGSLAGDPLVTQVGGSSQVTFSLKPLAAKAGNSLVVQVVLDADLAPGLPLTSTAVITAAGDLNPADNRAEVGQLVQEAGPDVWVSLASKGETELGGKLSYRLSYGNRGTEAAQGVVVSLALPPALKDVRFSVQPDAVANGSATWKLDTLQAGQGGGPIEVSGSIGGTGSATANARIASSTADAYQPNDTAEVAAEFVALQMPVIAGPSNAVVSDRPVFSGQGKPSAEVSLYLAGVDGQPGTLLGTGLVDGSGRWEITPSTSLPLPGWYWFTATQQLGDLVSQITGTANYFDDKILIDSSSLTVNGARVGGIDQDIAWPEGKVLTFGARIVSCAKPLTPTLQVEFSNNDGTVTNRRVITPKRFDPDGYVEFDYQVPRANQQVQWQMALSFYCQDGGQSSVQPRVRTVKYVAGVLDWLKRKIDCWFGCEKQPPPPPPPQPCQGCTPLDRKTKPKPDFFGPPEDDHFAYFRTNREESGIVNL